MSRKNETRKNVKELGKHATARRRGQVVVLFAVLLVLIIGMIAFAVDIGMMTNHRTELQNKADSAALAGVGRLDSREYVRISELTARRYFETNQDSDLNDMTADTKVQAGYWDAIDKIFTPYQIGDANEPNAVRVFS